MTTAPAASVDPVVARTILEQLGGRRFIAMTGASNFTGGERSLVFRLPRSKDGANVVRITLTDRDDYDFETLSVRRVNGEFTHRLKTQRSGVYCDNLQEVFTSVTGLYTHL